jgi:hypothetical protein
MEAHQRELEEMMEKIMNANHNEERPTLVERKPEVAKQDEVPNEDAVVKPVKGQKKQ